MSSYTLNELLVFITICVVSLPVILFYLRWRKKKWLRVLDESFQYHRYHLLMARDDMTLQHKSREIARAMLHVIDRQLKSDFKRNNVNLGGFLKSILGMGTSLQLSGEIHYQVMRYHYDVDEIIVRLYNTFSSTLYRLFFLNSIVMPLAILFMDFFYVLSLTGLRKNGPLCLFRDLHRGA